MANILLIDLGDSFSYNLVDLLRTQQHQVRIYRATIAIETLLLALQQVDNPIVILAATSGIPDNIDHILKILRQLRGNTPIIGIGLGHLALIAAYGGRLVPCVAITHGESALISHHNQAMFTGLPNPLKVALYHSWVADTLPSELSITAHYHSMVMAVQHVQHPICGFQFHPESILTPDGARLIQQTLAWIQFSQ